MVQKFPREKNYYTENENEMKLIHIKYYYLKKFI